VKTQGAGDLQGLTQLLITIEAECRVGGAFASDPRSAELLEVARRLQGEVQPEENREQSTAILPEIVVPKTLHKVSDAPERPGSFGRLLLFAFLLLAWICIVTVLVEWMQSA
jgi:hypothetical protein